MRSHLFGNRQYEALALDGMAVRIFVEREGNLLLDLLQLRDQFFQLQAAETGFCGRGNHSREEAISLSREQEICHERRNFELRVESRLQICLESVVVNMTACFSRKGSSARAVRNGAPAQR